MYNNTTITFLAMALVNGRSTFIWQINYSISVYPNRPIYNDSIPFYCQGVINYTLIPMNTTYMQYT